MPIFRKRLLVDEWVIIAPERASRPRQLGLSLSASDDNFCPFCQENTHVTPPTIQSWPSPTFGDQDWGVRAVPNKYPALRVEEENSHDSDGLYVTKGGVGAHEVIIESPDHRTDWHEVPAEHLALVFAAWQDRMRDLRRDRRLRCAIAFKNHGAVAGATLAHIHSQLVALPFIPPSLQREFDGARRHYENHQRCLLCEMIDRERESGQRVVMENETAIAITPFASRMPFEIWILPRTHHGDFMTATAEVLAGVAALTHRILPLWQKAIGSKDYNCVLHCLPFDFAGEPYYHWHLEMLPRTGQIAGFEWGTKTYINATPSEVAARHLRELAN